MHNKIWHTFVIVSFIKVNIFGFALPILLHRALLKIGGDIIFLWKYFMFKKEILVASGVN